MATSYSPCTSRSWDRARAHQHDQMNIKAPCSTSRIMSIKNLEVGTAFPDLGALESLRAKRSGSLPPYVDPRPIFRSGKTKNCRCCPIRSWKLVLLSRVGTKAIWDIFEEMKETEAPTKYPECSQQAYGGTCATFDGTD